MERTSPRESTPMGKKNPERDGDWGRSRNQLTQPVIVTCSRWDQEQLAAAARWVKVWYIVSANWMKMTGAFFQMWFVITRVSWLCTWVLRCTLPQLMSCFILLFSLDIWQHRWLAAGFCQVSVSCVNMCVSDSSWPNQLCLSDIVTREENWLLNISISVKKIFYTVYIYTAFWSVSHILSAIQITGRTEVTDSYPRISKTIWGIYFVFSYLSCSRGGWRIQNLPLLPRTNGCQSRQVGLPLPHLSQLLLLHLGNTHITTQ